MSSWDGLSDGENSDDMYESPPRSPFSTAFNTPRPAGIITNGVKEVPPSFNEHPEDLYDTLQVEFEQAMIHNPERKHKTHVTREERGHLIRHLTMTEERWKALPKAEKGILKRNHRHKALTYFGVYPGGYHRRPREVIRRKKRLPDDLRLFRFRFSVVIFSSPLSD